ncbi:hypothetical protein [Rhabdochromatium marinum]|uniref:hypothetical protein n=1 Tax=Rhabdochromatium marinum TaxID=48729 RepID=UPI001908C379|nr:hypothetical protein [Rhabdochromatium marinum]MBK1648985.1 hypothetical protein [Rhabdochromatium marinum]
MSLIDFSGRVVQSGDRITINFFTPIAQLNKKAYLNEPALAEYWLKSEEDAAWAHLQPDGS